MKTNDIPKEQVLHTLWAYKYYLSALFYCCFDEITAEYIIEHWDEDYDIIEEYSKVQ